MIVIADYHQYRSYACITRRRIGGVLAELAAGPEINIGDYPIRRAAMTDAVGV